jgi:NAD(P)-dependent dehydrogenase (short-subunit alcohol dehydrogenase family)
MAAHADDLVVLEAEPAASSGDPDGREPDGGFPNRVRVDLDDPAAVVRALDAAVAMAGADSVDAVVYAHLDPEALRPRPIVELTDDDWDRTCERQLRAALNVTRAAHDRLQATAGSLVFVCPTIALQGAAGLTPLAAAAEGQRVLAKSAARQWADDGIRVNIVAPATADLMDDATRTSTATADARRGRIPMGAGFDLDAALAGLLGFLVSDASRYVTGVTIPVDRAQVTAL